MSVLRASKLGFPCSRNLWYSQNGTEAKVSQSSQRIFDVGTTLEPLIVEWLKQDGWEVEYNPGSQNAELELTIELEHGELCGHPDCFISKSGKRYLVDIKTMNDHSFAEWKREGTLKSKPQYVVQLHIYAKACGAEHLGIVGVNKNNSAIHIDFFDFDPSIWEQIVGKAETIFLSDEAPVENCPQEKWCCSYCEYSHVCDLFQPFKSMDIPSLDAVETEDTELLSAFEMLTEAREIKKKFDELDKQAKDIIDSKLKALGTSEVCGGGYHFLLKEVKSSRFDGTAFKKAYPELAKEFTKTQTTVRYELERNP